MRQLGQALLRHIGKLLQALSTYLAPSKSQAQLGCFPPCVLEGRLRVLVTRACHACAHIPHTQWGGGPSAALDIKIMAGKRTLLSPRAPLRGGPAPP